MSYRRKRPEVGPDGRVRRSRRQFFVAAACGTVAALLWPAPPASAKTSKAAAKYQDKPNGKQHCAICRFFEKPHSCRLVEGEISPEGWCRFFGPKD